MNIEQAIESVSGWLGKDKISSIFDDGNIIVVQTIDGSRPSWLPNRVDIYWIRLEQGGPYQSQVDCDGM